MLKNLDPLLTGDLLAVLDAMEPGDWLTLTSGTAKTPALTEGHTVVEFAAASVEAVVTALLSVLPLDAAETPIIYLDDPGATEELPDVVFAVCGIAADAELRRVPMSTLGEREFRDIAVDAAATVRADLAGKPASFLLRKGDLLAA